MKCVQNTRTDLEQQLHVTFGIEEYDIVMHESLIKICITILLIKKMLYDYQI